MLLGILPCSGSQTRMRELSFSKELLPLFDGRPVIQHSIDALRQATPHLRAAVHPQKKDLARYLKSQGVEVLIEARPRGLPASIAFAASRHPGPVLFCLPDTFYTPQTVFLKLKHTPHLNVLGLFKASHPDRFDSVLFNSQNLITRYRVKVDPPLSSYTMGCGKLSPEAIDLFDPGSSDEPGSAHPELIFGNLIQPLIKQRQLYGLPLSRSAYFDLGTPGSYIEYLMHRYGDRQS